MVVTKTIKDLDQLHVQAFRPPPSLVGMIEEAEVRGEPWWVLMAYGGGSGDARWLAVLPSSDESWFFLEGDQLCGRWDVEHEVFCPEEGSPLNLMGIPVSLSSLEEDAEDEEGWREGGSTNGQRHNGFL